MTADQDFSLRPGTEGTWKMGFMIEIIIFTPYFSVPFQHTQYYITQISLFLPRHQCHNSVKVVLTYQKEHK